MLLPFFKFLGDSRPALLIRDSVWIYAFDQCAHLVALAVFAGAVLILDLRLLGGGLRDRPIAQVARDAQPWLVWAFVGLVVTGIPQLMSNSIKEYYSIYFWVKMGLLLPAFIFTFTIRRNVAMSAPSGPGSFQTKIVGLVSIMLWASVAVTARLIGLLS
jgi:putative copper export protein